jgi:hypothetical protein
MQLYQHVLRFAAAHGERRVTDSHYEGITPRAGFSQDLDLLAVDESELEQSPLECRERGVGARADTDHASACARRQRRQTHVARVQGYFVW